MQRTLEGCEPSERLPKLGTLGATLIERSAGKLRKRAKTSRPITVADAAPRVQQALAARPVTEGLRALGGVPTGGPRPADFSSAECLTGAGGVFILRRPPVHAPGVHQLLRWRAEPGSEAEAMNAFIATIFSGQQNWRVVITSGGTCVSQGVCQEILRCSFQHPVESTRRLWKEVGGTNKMSRAEVGEVKKIAASLRNPYFLTSQTAYAPTALSLSSLSASRMFKLSARIALHS